MASCHDLSPAWREHDFRGQTDVRGHARTMKKSVKRRRRRGGACRSNLVDGAGPLALVVSVAADGGHRLLGEAEAAVRCARAARGASDASHAKVEEAACGGSFEMGPSAGQV